MRCPRCDAELDGAALEGSWYVCPACGAHLPIPARLRIAQLADPGSFREYDRDLISVDPIGFTDHKPYVARLREAEARTGLREAVLTGRARIGGVPCVLVVFDFAFLGGTIGSCVGERVARAFERATRRRRPLVAVVSSAGARMQEGPLALFQVSKVMAALLRHEQAGLPFVALLTHPAFGGALTSFASRADVLLAEPEALMGFVGPRVAEGAFGERLVEAAYRSEAWLQQGLVDEVVPRPGQRERIGELLQLLRPVSPRTPQPAPRVPEPPFGEGSAWDVVQGVRHPDRPTALQYLRRIAHPFVELRGDRATEDDPAVVGGLARIAGYPVVVIAQERSRRGGLASPAGYRKAIRLLRLAHKVRLPVVTLLDTPGADAEHPGIAHALAECLGAMLSVRSPTVGVLTGEGAGAGTISLAAADRLLMLEGAVCSVMTPEGAAAILYRDPSRAPEMAERLRLRATDLRALGLVDRIVPEPPGGAHTDPDAAAELLGAALGEALREVAALPERRRLRQRYRRYRRVGAVGSARRAWMVERIAGFRAALRQRLAGRRPHPAPGV